MEANSSVYMQLKLSQLYGHRGNQSKIACGLNQNDLEQKLYFFLKRILLYGFLYFLWKSDEFSGDIELNAIFCLSN